MVVLVIGGSGSGKSEYAENLAVRIHRNELVYIATMQPFDEECKIRIKKHQVMRQEKEFTTKECYTGLKQVQLEDSPTVLLECMSNLVANEMFSPTGAKDLTIEVVMIGIKKLIDQAENVIVVTNNIYEDGADYDSTTLNYMEILGKINGYIAEISDKVVEVVHGIEVIIKEKRQENE
jgi:adenosylcobinamide kinase/adenosylcobinamide-phosphate guanylyltransferase